MLENIGNISDLEKFGNISDLEKFGNISDLEKFATEPKTIPSSGIIRVTGTPEGGSGQLVRTFHALGLNSLVLALAL